MCICLNRNCKQITVSIGIFAFAFTIASLKLGSIIYRKICHYAGPHSSADVDLHCAVPMQFCADICVQLLHRATRSKIRVVKGMSCSRKSLRGKDPHCSRHWRFLQSLAKLQSPWQLHTCCGSSERGRTQRHCRTADRSSYCSCQS